MAELKTQKNDASIQDFLAKIDNEQKRKDSKELLKIFSEVTDEKPTMWGDSIIGFGEYHYKYESGQEGDWPITGFSPRKQSISIYIMPGFSNYKEILNDLGKHKTSKGSCLYINKLADINTKALKKLIKKSVTDMKEKYPTKTQ